MNNEKLEIPNETSEFSYGFSSDGYEVQMEFADGVHEISDEIIRGLGGVEALKEKAPLFKEVNFADFKTAFYRTMEAETLNRIGANFIKSHFKRF